MAKKAHLHEIVHHQHMNIMQQHYGAANNFSEQVEVASSGAVARDQRTWRAEAPSRGQRNGEQRSGEQYSNMQRAASAASPASSAMQRSPVYSFSPPHVRDKPIQRAAASSQSWSLVLECGHLTCDYIMHGGQHRRQLREGAASYVSTSSSSTAWLAAPRRASRPRASCCAREQHEMLLGAPPCGQQPHLLCGQPLSFGHATKVDGQLHHPPGQL
ncbi:hypothetical protein Dimus_008457 [Dionaea muscipula]